MLLIYSWRKKTHTVGPGRSSISNCLLLIETVCFVQPLPVFLRLAVLVGKAPHCLHVGEGLCGHLIGFGQRLLHFPSNSLMHKHKSFNDRFRRHTTICHTSLTFAGVYPMEKGFCYFTMIRKKCNK